MLHDVCYFYCCHFFKDGSKSSESAAIPAAAGSKFHALVLKALEVFEQKETKNNISSSFAFLVFLHINYTALFIESEKLAHLNKHKLYLIKNRFILFNLISSILYYYGY